MENRNWFSYISVFPNTNYQSLEKEAAQRPGALCAVGTPTNAGGAASLPLTTTLPLDQR